MIRVRIAPSPTGIPHIGNTRTALFNYLFAKHNKGKFLLRIEDTDRARLVPESEKAIYEILEWLGLLWDEKYIQSERIDIYKDHTEELLEKGYAYKDEGAVRFKVSKNKEVSWKDQIGEKKISFKTNVIEDFVILKSDGYPTYHLASVVDDHLMDISHVIRGDEWISSTPKHLFLYEAFGWQPPIFAHLPVILGPDKTKLSKRHGAKSILDYRDEGYLKEALLNFMALLGWNPGGDREIMSLSEMIELFDLGHVNTASPIFDIEKLEWMNGIYIRRKFKKNELIKELINFPYAKQSMFLRKNNTLYNDEKTFKNIIKFSYTRVKTLKDFFKLTDQMFFAPSVIKLNKVQLSIIKELIKELENIKIWEQKNILETLLGFIKTRRMKMSDLYYFFTGQESGLPLPESLEIIGKKKTIERLNRNLQT